MTEIYLAEAIFRVIRERRNILQDALVFGEVKNMEHYREIIGGLKSLEHIEQELKSLLDKQEQVDDLRRQRKFVRKNANTDRLANFNTST